MARVNSETLPRFLQRRVRWENTGLPARRSAEEAFVLTFLAEAHFPPSPCPCRPAECLWTRDPGPCFLVWLGASAAAPWGWRGQQQGVGGQHFLLPAGVTPGVPCGDALTVPFGHRGLWRLCTSCDATALSPVLRCVSWGYWCLLTWWLPAVILLCLWDWESLVL